MTSQIPSLHPTRAKISLPAFRHNMKVVRSLVGKDVQIMAVVKANAYGHGMRTIAYEAVRNGASYLAAARIDEGAELRRDGIKQPVLVFEIPVLSQIERALLDNLDLTIASKENALHVNAAAQKMKKKAKVHVKIDSGMGRLGFPVALAVENIQFIAGLAGLELAGVYSHFAASDETDLTYARVQLERFRSVLEELDKLNINIPLKHMANSGGIISLPESHFNMVRPGIMLYGYTPRKTMTTIPPLQPVMSLISKITFIKDVEPNTSISYNRKFFTKSKTRIATVPVGYGDGFSRALTNKANVLIRGKRFCCVGTICMDHLMVDLGLDASVQIGDDVVLVGADGVENISGWDIGEMLGTIPYEVTCNVSNRVQRAYSS
ncbi:MAG: alanine racemase [bacterium]